MAERISAHDQANGLSFDSRGQAGAAPGTGKKMNLSADRAIFQIEVSPRSIRALVCILLGPRATGLPWAFEWRPFRPFQAPPMQRRPQDRSAVEAQLFDRTSARLRRTQSKRSSRSAEGSPPELAAGPLQRRRRAKQMTAPPSSMRRAEAGSGTISMPRTPR